jgi:2-amino-4-hydroxy-6-hydroxymethyldihydropteridine diphosphokinase
MVSVNRAFIGVGSNTGNREHNCMGVIDALAGLPDGRIVTVSSLYETEPWGYARQRRFINCAVLLETGASAHDLLRMMQATERSMHKRANVRWGPRSIDLDLLLFNTEIINEPGLQVPHPRMHQRRFVLAPLCEIAPDVLHPVLRCSADELLRRLNDTKRVELLTESVY